MSDTPETVRVNVTRVVHHEEFLTALAPLLELLGRKVEEVFADLTIKPAENGDAVLLVTGMSGVDPEDGSEPVSIGEGEAAVSAWPFCVAVVV